MYRCTQDVYKFISIILEQWKQQDINKDHQLVVRLIFSWWIYLLNYVYSSPEEQHNKQQAEINPKKSSSIKNMSAIEVIFTRKFLSFNFSSFYLCIFYFFLFFVINSIFIFIIFKPNNTEMFLLHIMKYISVHSHSEIKSTNLNFIKKWTMEQNSKKKINMKSSWGTILLLLSTFACCFCVCWASTFFLSFFFLLLYFTFPSFFLLCFLWFNIISV